MSQKFFFLFNFSPFFAHTFNLHKPKEERININIQHELMEKFLNKPFFRNKRVKKKNDFNFLDFYDEKSAEKL